MEKKKEIKKLNLSKKNIQKLQKLDLEMLENTALELKNRLSSIVFAEKKNKIICLSYSRKEFKRNLSRIGITQC